MAKQTRHERKSRNVSNNSMLTLFRYYLRARRMFDLYGDAVKQANAKFGNDWWSKHIATDEAFEVWLFFDYWLAGLRTMVEGYKKLGLNWPTVEPLLKSEHLPMLNDYRNGVAHFVETFFDPNQHRLGVIDGGIDWAGRLFEAIGDGVRAEVKNRSDALIAAGISIHPSWL
jgi:hypothetical protein